MYMIKIKDMRTSAQTLLKRLAVGITTLLLASTSILAQGTAEVWLSKVTEKLQNKGTEISFRIDEEGMHLSGKLLIDGEKFLYDTKEIKIWYDGITQWTLQMGNEYNELYINNPTPEEQQSINPYLLLSNYKEHFTTTDGGATTLGGKPVHLVVLKAKHEGQEPETVNIYISGDSSLAAIEFASSSDLDFKIEVRSMRNGLTFPKGTFTFQAEGHQVDEIIDMR